MEYFHIITTHFSINNYNTGRHLCTFTIKHSQWWSDDLMNKQHCGCVQYHVLLRGMKFPLLVLTTIFCLFLLLLFLLLLLNWPEVLSTTEWNIYTILESTQHFGNTQTSRETLHWKTSSCYKCKTELQWFMVAGKRMWIFGTIWFSALID